MTPQETLKAENEALRKRNAVLEEVVGATTVEFPLDFPLTAHEHELLGIMMKRPILSRDAAMTILYGNRPNPPEEKVIDVLICKIRTKLLRFHVKIKTIRGIGYALTDENKQMIENLKLPKPPTRRPKANRLMAESHDSIVDL